MNKDDVTRMARQAGFVGFDGENKCLREFASLVAAHVRETEFKPDWNNYQQGLKDGAAEEREACADLIPPQYFELRERIRARGQA